MHAAGPIKPWRRLVSRIVASPTPDVMAPDRSVHTQQVSCTYTQYTYKHFEAFKHLSTRGVG